MNRKIVWHVVGLLPFTPTHGSWLKLIEYRIQQDDAYGAA